MSSSVIKFILFQLFKKSLEFFFFFGITDLKLFKKTQRHSCHALALEADNLLISQREHSPFRNPPIHRADCTLDKTIVFEIGFEILEITLKT